jgi:hypothetical protein
MRVGIVSVFTDYHRRGAHHRNVLQPQVGPLIAALLPRAVEVEIVNDAWRDPDWRRDYDLLFVSSLHSDFDRARQISHYWRRRGAKTVLGGTLASTYPKLCKPYFDTVVVGDPETTVPRIVEDFARRTLQPFYFSGPYRADKVPVPRLDLAAREQVLPLSFEVTRGCPFTCDFCSLTGIGTRYQTRPVDTVIRDIREGQRMLRGISPWYRRSMVIFYDNNLGGQLGYLRKLCDALVPMRFYWGACVTFNVICDTGLLDRMARAGCRGVFVGLETFNPRALAGMRKFQNVLGKIRWAIEQCQRRGIIVSAGMMLSPSNDDAAYIATIPRHLRDCGLHVPTYVCFETPFPGTPHFRNVASADPGAFLPNALLRDFDAYTLVTRPAHETAQDFVAAYKRLHGQLYSKRSKLTKWVHDAKTFLSRGMLLPVALDAYELFTEPSDLRPDRTFIAGSDVVPPETSGVPLCDDDFSSQLERDQIIGPWRVTDESGRALPVWLDSTQVFSDKGRSVVGPELVLSAGGQARQSAPLSLTGSLP